LAARKGERGLTVLEVLSGPVGGGVGGSSSVRDRSGLGEDGEGEESDGSEGSEHVVRRKVGLGCEREATRLKPWIKTSYAGRV
jgi:hypothetical protein